MSFTELEPLDPDEVKDYAFDFTDEIGANAIDSYAIDVSAGLAKGDGVTEVTTPSGNLTPPEPSVTGAVVTVWLYVASGYSPGKKAVTCHAIAGGRAYDKTFIVEVRSA